jgi:hypothetical protein
MLSTAYRLAALACLAAAVVLGGLTGAGCMTADTRLWADTAEADGSMSTQSHQWAYDGETVTLELEAPPAAAHYVIFAVGKEEIGVNTPMIPGRFRLEHVFHCGAKPQTFEVAATPFLIRGKPDWIYEEAADKWLFLPGRNDKPDVETASERTMKITCYRVEAHFRFAARSGPPKRVTLALLKADGQRIEVPQARPAETPGAAAKAGFLVLGPDAGGNCEVVYTPRYNEVSRAGKTMAELLIEHADGTLQRLQQELDTP